MSEDDEEMTSLEDIPISTNVSNKKRLLMTDPKTMEIYRNFVPVSLTWSNQGKSIGQWIQHIYSIFRCKWYEADFNLGNIRFDIQSLRIIFPKLIKIKIYCLTAEPNEHNIRSAQIILRAFLPYVKDVDLFSVPFQENLSLQHFGMANLRNLIMYQPPNMNFSDIFTWNADYSTFHTNQFSMRDMNRFFKLWTKGSFPRLGGWRVYGVINVDLSVLLKGIRPKKERKLEAEGAERELEFIIQNCHETLAEIRIYNNIRTNASVHFAVSSSR
ncbi:hypothetical protein B9Z55_011249 [Caenorhabditis nigoni]|uniref:Sdz-33 F-box domain-containing protein n=1 Tax=Caenorhabditis nigoni TaxID=1611254 RepID=A0A2G5UJD0_9PELO|nr:hypothetical protein B9Z55_011249 [Caenorhabditis nigoni]